MKLKDFLTNITRNKSNGQLVTCIKKNKLKEVGMTKEELLNIKIDSKLKKLLEEWKMNEKIICLIIVGFILVSFVVLLIYSKENKSPSTELYQGPVPEGYDEDYFRHTGITKKIGVDNG